MVSVWILRIINYMIWTFMNSIVVFFLIKSHIFSWISSNKIIQIWAYPFQLSYLFLVFTTLSLTWLSNSNVKWNSAAADCYYFLMYLSLSQGSLFLSIHWILLLSIYSHTNTQKQYLIMMMLSHHNPLNLWFILSIKISKTFNEENLCHLKL